MYVHVYGVGGGLLSIYATIDIGSTISDTKEIDRTSNLVGVLLSMQVYSLLLHDVLFLF